MVVLFNILSVSSNTMGPYSVFGRHFFRWFETKPVISVIFVTIPTTQEQESKYVYVSQPGVVKKCLLPVSGVCLRRIFVTCSLLNGLGLNMLFYRYRCASIPSCYVKIV